MNEKLEVLWQDELDRIEASLHELEPGSKEYTDCLNNYTNLIRAFDAHKLNEENCGKVLQENNNLYTENDIRCEKFLYEQKTRKFQKMDVLIDAGVKVMCATISSVVFWKAFNKVLIFEKDGIITSNTGRNIVGLIPKLLKK